MWYKIVKHTDGKYIDKNGTTYILVQCHRAMDKDGHMNAELGLTKFESLEQCLETWGLSRIDLKKDK